MLVAVPAMEAKVHTKSTKPRSKAQTNSQAQKTTKVPKVQEKAGGSVIGVIPGAQRQSSRGRVIQSKKQFGE